MHSTLPGRSGSGPTQQSPHDLLHRVPLRRFPQPFAEFTSGDFDRYFVPLFSQTGKPLRRANRRLLACI